METIQNAGIDMSADTRAYRDSSANILIALLSVMKKYLRKNCWWIILLGQYQICHDLFVIGLLL